MSTPELYLTPDERASLRKVLSDPSEFPSLFGAWIAQYVALNGKVHPYQIAGLSRLTPRSDAVATSESRGWNASYGDLATVGPQLDNLGSGTYLVMFSALVTHLEASVETHTSISINGAAPDDDDGVEFFTTSNSNSYPVTRYQVLDLPLPSNTLKCQYKRIGSGATAAFWESRFLTAIRMGNG